MIFDPGDEVLVAISNQANKLYYKKGTIIAHMEINHYLIEFNEDMRTYKCHTSQLISTEIPQEMERIETQ